MKLLNILFVMLCVGQLQTAHAAPPKLYSGPDFEATQLTTDKGGEPMKGTVYFSKTGSRLEFATPMGKTIAAADFNKGKCWFASVGQKIYMEGTINKKSGDCSANLSMGPTGGESVGGLMASAPCDGYTYKQKLGKGSIAGRAAEQWGCRDARAGEAMHWYDPKLKLVIGEETPYTKDKLSNIKFKKIDAGLFATPKGFKRVNKNQFMQALMSGAMQMR